ncbi:hypothetical protein BpHYR1_005147 [Brachionus plicatilis]|uniref:Uncharacterized protein n=1 Tax=Brachionus plicatilis TaxID=10195 RepID=A0A3M7SP50_BRAPC|nr:hypothetical protein BpHYR1_005147 [Brachionus plicatilis]
MTLCPTKMLHHFSKQCSAFFAEAQSAWFIKLNHVCLSEYLYVTPLEYFVYLAISFLNSYFQFFLSNLHETKTLKSFGLIDEGQHDYV